MRAVVQRYGLSCHLERFAGEVRLGDDGCRQRAVPPTWYVSALNGSIEEVDEDVHAVHSRARLARAPQALAVFATRAVPKLTVPLTLTVKLTQGEVA